jgi:TolB protein
VADLIYEKLTGDKGVFSTRIAYVTKAGSRFNLWVADADGENAQSALAWTRPAGPT